MNRASLGNRRGIPLEAVTNLHTVVNLRVTSVAYDISYIHMAIPIASALRRRVR